MACFSRSVKKFTATIEILTNQTRFSNTLGGGLIEAHRKPYRDSNSSKPAPKDYKTKHYEFLPQTDGRKRDRLAEMLERQDMLRRKRIVHIPEFYVGTIMAATILDPHSQSKQSRFVGICIQKTDVGLRSNFTLRNTVEGQGVEITYDAYCPLVTHIDVLRLEKRLDGELFYLRDSPLEFSTFPFDMAPLQHNPNEAVPVNKLKVKLNPRPWHERWERQNLQGVETIILPNKFWERAKEPSITKPWLKHDLMKQYRERINDEETEQIMSEIYDKISKMDEVKKTNPIKSKTVA